MKIPQPEFLEKYDFNKKSYSDFLSNNSPENQMDEFGNLVLRANIDESDIKDTDKYLIKVKSKKHMIDNSQVELFMDTELSEFKDQAEQPMEQADELISDFSDEVDGEIRTQLENENVLQVQLDEMSDILDKEIEKGVRFQEKSSENFTAAKDVIISQRISLGEGKTESDFSDKFPFLPLNETQEETGDAFPFMSS